MLILIRYLFNCLHRVINKKKRACQVYCCWRFFEFLFYNFLFVIDVKIFFSISVLALIMPSIAFRVVFLICYSILYTSNIPYFMLSLIRLWEIVPYNTVLKGHHKDILKKSCLKNYSVELILINILEIYYFDFASFSWHYFLFFHYF